MRDLFETPESLPTELQTILNSYIEHTYESCKAMLAECEAIGYTFDYYLDAEPYNLRRIASDGISAYAELIMEENDLHFIAFTDDQVLAIDLETKKVHYFYEVNEDISFHFNLISHVREMDAVWFKSVLESLNYTIDQEETETDYYDIITNY